MLRIFAVSHFYVQGRVNGARRPPDRSGDRRLTERAGIWPVAASLVQRVDLGGWSTRASKTLSVLLRYGRSLKPTFRSWSAEKAHDEGRSELEEAL